MYQISPASRTPDYWATAPRSPFSLSSTEFFEPPQNKISGYATESNPVLNTTLTPMPEERRLDSVSYNTQFLVFPPDFCRSSPPPLRFPCSLPPSSLLQSLSLILSLSLSPQAVLTQLNLGPAFDKLNFINTLINGRNPNSQRSSVPLQTPPPPHPPLRGEVPTLPVWLTGL